MDPLVSVLVLVLLALLGARFSFSTEGVPAGPRLLFRTGTHFVFVGFLLGPEMLGLLTGDSLRQLDPLLTLALGWVGFLFGLQLDRQQLAQFRARLYVLALVQAVLAFAVFAGVGWAVLGLAERAGEIELLLLMAAAATACITTPAGIALVSTNFLVRGRVRELLFLVASLDAAVGIVALQVVYSVRHPGDLLLGLVGVPPLGWILVALGLGVVCGILFLWLTRPKPGSEELVLFLLGITALASGAALELSVSPLFLAMTMGAVVANLHPDRRRVFDELERWEKPVYLVLLLLAGALVRFPTAWVIPMAIFYVAARFLGKLVGAAAAVRIVRLPFEVPRRVGFGLVPQGGISLAMAVSVELTYRGMEIQGAPAGELFFVVVLLGVLASELMGPFFVTNVLRRAGEISPRVEEALERGDEERAREEAIRHVPGSRNEEGS